MSVDEGRRKIAAILAADVAGYSRLMADDDRATVRTLTEYRRVFADGIEAHQGQIIDTTGDSVLAMFDSVVEAAEAAIKIQRALKERNQELASHRRMLFRIGVNLGDIILRDDGTIYGDGVNVAARLEGLAEPGGVMISQTAFDHVEGRLGVRIADAGSHGVKNIEKPVQAYRLVPDGAAPPVSSASTSRRRKLIAAGTLAAALVAGLAVWGLTIRVEAPQMVMADGTPTDNPILAMPTGPSIAVLPFEDMNGSDERDYFSDGITEELINELSRFRDLFIIARASTLQYRERQVDVRLVGEELGVRYVVQGSVRRAGETIRVSAQLIDAESGAVLWTDDYDSQLTPASFLIVQDAITEQIVATIADPMGGVLSLARLEETRSQQAESLQDYQCVLRAREYYRVETPDEHRAVRACLEEVVDQDPDYAEAWVWLAALYTEEYANQYNPRPDPLDRALEAGRRAVALKPKDALARGILARVHFMRHEFDAFRAEGERAVELNPNNTTVLAVVGLFSAYAGKWDYGVALVEKAMVLNPNHQGWLYFPIAWNHYRLHQYEQAAAAARKINAPGYHWNHVALAISYAQLGDLGKARENAERVRELYPEFEHEYYAIMQKWFVDAPLIEDIADGLRLAGLEITEGSDRAETGDE